MDIRLKHNEKSPTDSSVLLTFPQSILSLLDSLLTQGHFKGHLGICLSLNRGRCPSDLSSGFASP